MHDTVGNRRMAGGLDGLYLRDNTKNRRPPKVHELQNNSFDLTCKQGHAKRIRNKTESEVVEEQAGFRKGRGTKDQIVNLRIILYYKAKSLCIYLFVCSLVCLFVRTHCPRYSS